MARCVPSTLLAAALAMGCGGRSVVEGGAGGSGATGASGGTGGTSVRGGTTGGSAGTGGVAGTAGIGAEGGSGGQHSGTCGDRVREGSEACDDGNVLPGDGCSPYCEQEVHAVCPSIGGSCYFPSACGDGRVGRGEMCDDGNTTSGDGCSGDCATVEVGWWCRNPGSACSHRCGDGMLLEGEACDDGNASNGDGCSATCVIEPGFTCSGAPSDCVRAQCGNGDLEPGEACDLGADNGRFNGDGSGCTKTCRNEPACGQGASAGPCTTACGDGNVDKGEQCDDGNGLDGDGCSSDCRTEPGYTCVSEDQPDLEVCPSNPYAYCLLLPVKYRDFDGQAASDGHPDFMVLGAPGLGGTSPGAVSGSVRTTCVPDSSGVKAPFTDGDACPATDAAGPCPGLVEAVLGEDGKPVLARSTCPCVFTDIHGTGVLDDVPGVETCVGPTGELAKRIDAEVPVIQNAAWFADWFSDTALTLRTLTSTLELASVDGETRFVSGTPGAIAGAAGRQRGDDLHANCLGEPTPLTSGFFPFGTPKSGGVCNLSAYSLYQDAKSDADCVVGAGHPSLWEWDPSAAFDACPLSGDGGPVPSSTGAGTPVQGTLANFYFTSEVHYLYRYTGPFVLSFAGNDDFWAFIAGKLVLDLGGTHAHALGSVTIDDSFGLALGSTYELALFHANRHPPDSSFDLTLPPSIQTRSVCTPQCGDLITTSDEECDPPPRVTPGGGDTGCTKDCHFSNYCGDGVPGGSEYCDPGPDGASDYAPGPGYCTATCLPAPYCGDGFIDAEYGEACDDPSSGSCVDCRRIIDDR